MDYYLNLKIKAIFKQTIIVLLLEGSSVPILIDSKQLEEIKIFLKEYIAENYTQRLLKNKKRKVNIAAYNLSKILNFVEYGYAN